MTKMPRTTALLFLVVFLVQCCQQEVSAWDCNDRPKDICTATAPTGVSVNVWRADLIPECMMSNMQRCSEKDVLDIVKDGLVGLADTKGYAALASGIREAICAGRVYLSDQEYLNGLSKLWEHCGEKECDGQWFEIKRQTGICNFCRTVYFRADGSYPNWESRNTLLSGFLETNCKWQLGGNVHGKKTCILPDGVGLANAGQTTALTQQAALRGVEGATCGGQGCGWINVRATVTLC